MILEQHYLPCLAQASYFIGDEGTRTAVVVDPRRDVALYLERAARHGMSIRHVVLTHFHADFLAGHLELRERTGATIHMGARARAEFPFEAHRDGDRLELGEVVLRFLETPGHTPESICLLVTDRRADPDRPQAVLTGDTLFLGDVGRPDLAASEGADPRELAGLLYDSIREKLLPLPDDVLVYPGHGAGSACGKNLSSETVSTMGAQRRTNYALGDLSRDEFVDLLCADQPPAPAYFAYDAELNRRERPTLRRSLALALRPLRLRELLALAEEDASIVDTRDPDDYAEEHLTGSLSIGLGGRYASWAGTLLPCDRPIALVCDPGREHEAATRLGRIGFDHVVGYLDGGARALAARPDRTRSVRRLSSSELAARLADGPSALLLDVRGPGEFAAGHLPGARNVPLTELAERARELPRDRPLLVSCQSGYRSMIAAGLLERAGFEQLAEHRGGFADWAARGLPVEG